MTTILITAAGGAAVPGLIRGLQAQGYRVISVDANPQAAGLFVADAGRVIPKATSPDFLPALRRICRAEAVDVILPLVDEELIPTTELEHDGVAVITPRKKFIALCLDKYELTLALAAAGLDVPDTQLTSDPVRIPYPLVAKPRTGRGSRGMAMLADTTELEAHLSASGYSRDAMILQEFVDGPEFTVSVVAWRDGATQAVIPKLVLLKKGVTQLAVTRREPAIDAACRAIQQVFRADGPFNVQLRIDAAGRPKVFEINPRFSTTVSLTIAAGVDEPGALIRQALGGPPLESSEWTEGVVLVRQVADVFLDEATFTERERSLGVS